ncbi:hypothetical protein E1B28_012059 [Marasmius oreades]|uniref:Uncharacterized protein n=1 Tax=Marasmius oreades TaxID=181124 RepID=A0A9P7UMU2_9AGAR|nr:uncharacterized protein E1B28_012059 [Marasmius oreades]KAG7088022.1 hypothetical protein E1B28_012059 [Marasmius oreades]
MKKTNAICHFGNATADCDPTSGQGEEDLKPSTFLDFVVSRTTLSATHKLIDLLDSASGYQSSPSFQSALFD